MEAFIQMTDKKGLVGLTNIGNTCYGNATLQAVRHQVDFTLYLLQEKHLDILSRKQSNEKTRLLEKYVELIKKMWTGEGGTEKTREFWGYMVPAAIVAGVDHFRMPVAHDAHEFLVFLLDQFHEALSEQVNMVIKVDSTKPLVKDALQFWKSSFEKSYSPLVELVFTLNQKCIQCEECKKESISWETLNMMKVSVPKSQDGPVHILDLMKKEMKEELEDYTCEGCKKKGNVKVEHRVWRLGNWVIVVLKRNENSGRRINTQVEIPLTLSFNDLFHPLSEEPSRNVEYELFSTIHHHGSAGGGHYTSQAKHPVSGEWSRYDDEAAMKLEKPNLDESTYIVMYRKVAN
jgi:ubiquitin C-terminal hydrolase